MNPETVDLTASQPEALAPFDRFGQLLGFMEQYAEGDGHWRQLPPVKLKIKDNPPVLIRFFIYLPEFSRYSPSILMEAGQEERDPITGKRISGDIEQTFVRRNFLKKSSAYYPKYHEMAEVDLERIEGMFYAYKDTIDSFGRTE